jgi:hypothetical protein
MPDEVSIVIDSVKEAQLSPKPLVIAAFSDSTSIKDSSLRMQIPAWKDTVSITPSTAYPLRHDGLLRPVSLTSETFMVVSVFCILLIVNRVVKNSSTFFPEIIKNLFFMDEHSFSHETMPRRSLNFLWPINILLISLSGKMYIEHFGPTYMVDSWLFWKLALFTAVFLTVMSLFYRLIALVFFNTAMLKRWTLANTFIISFFSITLIPLLLLNELGVHIPSYFIFLWPSFFLLLPRVVYSMKGLNFFLLEKGAYFYMILYLCALEILPLFVFLKGVFLIQFNL